MRTGALILAFVIFSGSACTRTTKVVAISATPATELKHFAAPSKIDFATQVRPILEARCQPCHFTGGKVYQRLPFDRSETIKTLGTKLFTRIKDENERQIIRKFLAENQ